MKSRTLVSCSKAIVLIAATLVSAVTFAATCPNVSEIHPDNAGHWVTDSGWSSTSPGTSGHPVPVAFIKAKIDQIPTGKMQCIYSSKATSDPLAPDASIIMERPHYLATVAFKCFEGTRICDPNYPWRPGKIDFPDGIIIRTLPQELASESTPFGGYECVSGLDHCTFDHALSSNMASPL